MNKKKWKLETDSAKNTRATTFSEKSPGLNATASSKNTPNTPTTGQVESSDFVAIQAEMIFASLTQPETKPITLEKLLSEDQGVPIELGEFFSKTVNNLTRWAVDDLRFLLEQLDEESRTRLFRLSAL